MRRTFTIVAIAALVLAGIVKLVAAPSRTAGSAEYSNRAAISIDDLHSGHPDLKGLPVEVAPQP